jgi:hypothetical protein
MSDYLESIHQRLGSESASILAWELEQAFSEAIAADPAWATPRVRELHGLLRFTKFDAIAPWLKNERDGLAQALAFAQRIGDDKVAKILGEALAGKTQGEVKFTLDLPGRESQELNVDAGEVTRYDGKNWGGTDIALSFAMDGFTEAVVREVATARDLALEPPQAERKKAAANRAIAARAQDASAASLFASLVSAKNPRLEVGSWEDFEARRVDGNTVIAVTHNANPPADAPTIAAMLAKYGEVARDLLAAYEKHDGASLFQHGDTCGFYIAPIAEWGELHERAVEWAEEVTWGGEHEEIPPYFYSAIAFGMIPGDSERWLLITEGEHKGKIMLSDTDLIEDSTRFAGITEFMAALHDDAARVLNCGGYVRYLLDGEERFAVRYLSE